MARITDLEAIESEQVNASRDLLHIVDVSDETSVDKKITVEKLLAKSPDAGSAARGFVNTSAQNIAGVKTFEDGIVVDNIHTSGNLDLTMFTRFVVVNAVPEVANMEERVLYLYNTVNDVYQGYYLIKDGNNRSRGQIGGRSYTGGTGITVNDSTAVITNDLAASGGTLGGNTSVQGDLTVTGDIYQQGTSYETHAEKLYTKKDMIITRDGAQSPLATGEMSGIKAEHYNLDGDDGVLAFDSTGTARVGDDGDTQPLLTRAEEADLTGGHLLTWDATNKKAADGGDLGTAIDNKIAALDVASVGGSGKYISAISEADGKISATASSLDTAVTTGSAAPVTSGAVATALAPLIAATNEFDHNIPRWINGVLGKDITSYYTDGTLWKRLNGTDGFTLLEDIYVGDYFQMSRAITAPNQDSQYAVTGSQWVTIAGINTLRGNGDNIDMEYNHLVMIPGKGETGDFHFGRKRMNSSHTTSGGYVSSEMHASTLGAVVSSGSTASGATINQQLYAEFGAHLKTTRELLSSGMGASLYNRYGSATGASNNWGWYDCQACLMSEVEVYGSIVWSSSGFDTGTACKQLPLFAFSKKAINNRSAYYWLKDVASSSSFCDVSANGLASITRAGNTNLYVRPRFVLGA